MSFLGCIVFILLILPVIVIVDTIEAVKFIIEKLKKK